MLPTILHVQGDTFLRDIIVEKDGEPLDVTGWKWWLTCKAAETDTDEQALFQLSTDAGTIVPTGTGRLRATGLPALTESAATGRYLLDIQFQDLDGNVKTYWRGYLRIVTQITRAS